MTNKVFVFREGQTEEKVINRLGGLINNIELDCRPKAGGKHQINRTIVKTLGPNIESEPVRCLILRDLDMHDGETIDGIVQSTQDAIQQMFQQRGVAAQCKLNQLQNTPNVFVYVNKELDFRLALHIADYRQNQQFIKATIDDYILRLALEPNIAIELAKSQRLNIDSQRLITKITQEVPQLLHANGIELSEAKDYIRIYAAIIKTHTSPPVFAEKTLSHADSAAISTVFQAMIAAIESLV